MIVASIRLIWYCTCVRVCAQMCISKYVCVYMCIHTCFVAMKMMVASVVLIWESIFACVCMRTYTYVYIRMCMMYMYTCICIHIYTYLYTFICIYVYVYICTHSIYVYIHVTRKGVRYIHVTHIYVTRTSEADRTNQTQQRSIVSFSTRCHAHSCHTHKGGMIQVPSATAQHQINRNSS